MPKRAHWATVASKIYRSSPGLTWKQALGVYHRLSHITRTEAGHRPGLVDVKRYEARVEKAKELVVEAGEKVKTIREFRSFADRVQAEGIDPKLFTKQSERFAERGVPATALARLAKIVASAHCQIRKSGKVSGRTKNALVRLMDDYDGLFDFWEYYDIFGQLYG